MIPATAIISCKDHMTVTCMSHDYCVKTHLPQRRVNVKEELALDVPTGVLPKVGFVPPVKICCKDPMEDLLFQGKKMVMMAILESKLY